jgi:protein TonB
MKDRTVLVSAAVAAVFHAIILFANIGMARPTLASAPSTIEVTLVAAPATQAAVAQTAERIPEPEQLEPPEKAVAEPEPVIEPEPAVIPDPEPIPEPEPEPVVEPEPLLESIPEVEPEPIPEPVVDVERDADATGRTAREENFEEAPQETPAPSPSVDSPGETTEPGGLIQNATPTFDRSPAYTYNPIPKYPRAARRLRREGTAVLLVEILASGRVGKVLIEKSSGHELLDNAALKAVRRWRFEPATKAGVSVKATVKIPVEFDLKDAR